MADPPIGHFQIPLLGKCHTQQKGGPDEGEAKLAGRDEHQPGWFQWEYWNFAGGLDGDFVVEYGDDGGTGFIGKLSDATIEEKPEIATDRRYKCLTAIIP